MANPRTFRRGAPADLPSARSSSLLAILRARRQMRKTAESCEGQAHIRNRRGRTPGQLSRGIETDQLLSTARPAAGARRVLRVEGATRLAFPGLSPHEARVAGGFPASREAPGGVFPGRLLPATCDFTRNPRLLPAKGRNRRSDGPVHPQVRPRFHEVRVAGGKRRPRGPVHPQVRPRFCETGVAGGWATVP